MASLIYDSFVNDLSNNAVNPGAATFKALLTTSSYVPAKGTHAKRSDITGEVAGTGYTAGGTAVTVTVATNTSTHATTYSFSTPSWASSTITATGAVIYAARGGAATADNLVEFLDFGGTFASTNGTFSVTITPLTLQN